MNDIEKTIDRADELSGGKVTPAINMVAMGKEFMDAVMPGVFPQELPLVSVGPSGIGGYCQRETKVGGAIDIATPLPGKTRNDRPLRLTRDRPLERKRYE